MPEAVLVSAVRTPVGRAPKGALSTTRPDDLAALAVRGALDRVPELDRGEIDDVILGCAQPEGEEGWNIVPGGFYQGRSCLTCEPWGALNRLERRKLLLPARTYAEGSRGFCAPERGIRR
jgi:hypothetical protein